MHTLVIVRHGQSETNDLLTDRGVSQMEVLGDALRERYRNANFLVLTSAAPRARRSTNVLSKRLASMPAIETHETLWSQDKRPPDYDAVLELVDEREKAADVIVLVTHAEYADNFPSFYATARLGTRLDSHYVEHGRAWIVDI